ncbi:MAG: trehalose utilization protein ThuA, partial [Capsulimonas sp.]
MTEQTPVKVLVWDEAPAHAPREVYPQSINGAIAAFLNEDGAGRIEAVAANIDDPEQGLSEQAIADADVIIWWGHARHEEV